MSTVDTFTQALKTLNKPIDEVLKYPPGPKRWRAAHDLLWLNISWSNQLIYKEVVENNRITRDLVNEHGMAKKVTKAESSEKNLRNALNIPTGAYYAITKSDPQIFSDKRNFAKFMKTFPEYMTREKI